MRAHFLVGFVALAACGPRAELRTHVAWPDAPLALRDAGDRDQAIDHLWATPPGAARDRDRAPIAEATARRLADAIDDAQPFAAAQLLAQLAWLWHEEPAAAAAGLAPHAALLGRARAMFAKSGQLDATVQVLALLAEVDAPARAQHLAELDEVLAFADDLATADNGADATRAQPIALIQPAVLALPLPWLVERYVHLVADRQRAVSALIDKRGASIELVRAHRDVLESARRIANALARAGRTADIAAALAPMAGLGADPTLAARARAVVERPTPAAYLDLATQLRTAEHAGDPAAALAVCTAGLARFPGDADLLAAAGGDARALGRVDQAIALYEAALPAATEIDAVTALRLGKLYAERIERLAATGRPTRAAGAWTDALHYTARVSVDHPHIVWQQTAAIAESALGRGLASQGLLPEARDALLASIERAPSIDAYETLATIGVQTGAYADAQHWADTGLALLGEQSTGDRYRRAKLERLAGDGLRRAGKAREATARYLESLRGWASLGEPKALPKQIVAERLLDSGRAMWWLGDAQHAIELVMGAADLGAESPAVPASAVAFLVEAGRYREAIDAFHRGLGEPAVGELDKVYMSLWVVGEAKRLGEAPDRLATEYLASRRGDVWYELLAQAASGKVDAAALRAAATTGPRRAELAFYGAVLGFDPAAATVDGRRRLLEESVAARLVLDAEYDLARAYLGRP